MTTKGKQSLIEAVQRDCEKGENCFNENGCTKERFKNFPETDPSLIKMGFKTKCISQTKCFHDYCGKYKWIMERAQHYALKTGKTVDEILEVWENDRTYWYMNYYQECNQPLLEGENIIMYDDWIKELKHRFGDDAKKWAFVCPACGNIQTCQDFIDLKIESPESKVYFNCIGRYTKTSGCDWSIGGLLKINKQTVIKDGKAFPVFEMAKV
jgi:hypothetical protein